MSMLCGTKQIPSTMLQLYPTHQLVISPLCPDSILSLMTTSLVTPKEKQVENHLIIYWHKTFENHQWSLSIVSLKKQTLKEH